MSCRRCRGKTRKARASRMTRGCPGSHQQDRSSAMKTGWRHHPPAVAVGEGAGGIRPTAPTKTGVATSSDFRPRGDRAHRRAAITFKAVPDDPEGQPIFLMEVPRELRPFPVAADDREDLGVDEVPGALQVVPLGRCQLVAQAEVVGAQRPADLGGGRARPRCRCRQRACPRSSHHWSSHHWSSRHWSSRRCSSLDPAAVSSPFLLAELELLRSFQ